MLTDDGLLCRFRDGCGLQFILTTQMQDLMKSQKTVQEAVKSLEGPASKKVIDEATICHLRPNRLPLNKYVSSQASFQEFISLFSLQKPKMLMSHPGF